jgi:predicted nucleotidyltransferase
MLQDSSLLFIRAVAEEYRALRVLLFGSCLRKAEIDADDIDIAVESLTRKDCEDFWDRLLWANELY